MTKSLFGQLLLALLLGAMAVFSYSPFDLSLIAFISFSGFLLLIGNKKTKLAALFGLFWGIGYFSAGVHWVYVSIKQYGELPTPVALSVLSLFIIYLSIYPALFALLLRLLKKVAPAYSIKQLVFLAPILWQLTEFLRGTLLNGFSWLEFGYTQLHSPLKGLFPMIGIKGVNLAFSCICGLIVYAIYHCYLKLRRKQSINRAHFIGAIVALITITIVPLLLNLISWTQLDSSRNVKVSLVQANIAQSLRWNSQQLKNTLLTYSSLTIPLLESSDIIIWPEAAITDLETNQQQYLQKLDELAIENNTSIAVGIIDYKRDVNHYGLFNSLIVLGDNKPYQYPTTNRYAKYHLVPFGEYIPLQSLLKPLAELLNIPMSSMSAGDKIQPALIMNGYHFTTVICYEVVLSDIILSNFNDSTDFLLTVSNDAWFGDSIGPWQHLQMAQARALEFGRTLIRSTNNGITVIIAPDGSITNQSPQFEKTVLSANLIPSTGLTPYAKWGNKPLYVLFSIFILLIIIRKKNK